MSFLNIVIKYVAEKIGIGVEDPRGTVEIAKNNEEPAIVLTHPDSTDEKWDGGPLAALTINAAPTPITRNFVSGIYVVTNGGAVDKGRGILVLNLGQSDAIYVQNDHPSATGLAVLSTVNAPNATNVVIGTTLASQTALDIRQAVDINPNASCNTLLSLQANGSLAEMSRISSTINGQVGFVFRLFGSNTIPICIKGPSGDDRIVLYGNGRGYFSDGVILRNASGTVTKRVFLNAAGNGLIFESL